MLENKINTDSITFVLSKDSRENSFIDLDIFRNDEDSIPIRKQYV